MVLYRKYRSQTLDELVGQSHVKEALKAALDSGKLAHAYLFCGPRGTGKTSTARILAKIVNCESERSAGNSTPLPCNKCPSCLATTDGSHLDVIEMDAASNRGIEDIRTLRDNIKLAPSTARKKVYIIDEVHMLTGDAFNALLKTLEEPPSHVLFILATTEVQKIPATILSRVQRLDFKPATLEEMLAALEKVVQAEKIEIEDNALVSLAKKAQGSFRDGIKLLDQLAAFGTKIDLRMVEENLGSGTFEKLSSLLNLIAAKNTKEALAKMTEIVSAGVNLKELNLSILDLLRQLLLIKNNLGESLVKDEVGLEKYQILSAVADQFALEELVRVIDNFSKSLDEMRFVSLPSLPIEMAVVESCLGQALSGTDQENKIAVKESVAKPEVLEKPKEQEILSQEEVVVETVPVKSLDADTALDLQKIQERWNYILETVRQYNFSLEALLRTAKIAASSEKLVSIEVPYSFHQRILEAPKSKSLLESIFSDILARSVKVTTIIGQRPIRKEEVANVEVAADDEIVRIASEIFNSDNIN